MDSMTRFALILTVIAVAAILLGATFRGRAGRAAEARAAVSAGATLLDVRTPEEFAEGHLPGAINIPVQELTARIAELGREDRPIVVYCRSGARSSSARRMLEAAGHQKVIDLGPKSAW